MPEVEDATKYQQLAGWIRNQIDNGTYRPGDKIPSVRKLRDQYGVSVTTVLEACRALEGTGHVISRPRSGFVVQPRRPSTARPAPDASKPSARARRIDAPLSVRLNLGIGNPQTPTLGAAVQGPELMPIAALNRAMSQALRYQPDACHSYDAPPGSLVLRRAIARRSMDMGCAVTPDDLVITSGAKEAVYLSIRAVTKPGDTVAIESPTYYALLEVLASLGLRVVEIASDPADGIDLDHLSKALGRQRIAAVAIVSNFSNPTGACMSDEKKQRLVHLLEAHSVPLVEDDVYGDLVFDGIRPKAIKAFDTQGLVLYCGSYSKTLSPGLRVGWGIPGRYQNEFEHLKLVVNQATATAPQLAIAAFVDTGGFDRHLRRVRHAYREQMATTIEAVTTYFPDSTRHTNPAGGHVLWVQLPDGVDSLELYEAARQEGVTIAPGPLFSPSRGYRGFIRLNTGFPWSSAIEAQIRRLGRLVAARS